MIKLSKGLVNSCGLQFTSPVVWGIKAHIDGSSIRLAGDVLDPWAGWGTVINQTSFIHSKI